MQIRKVCKKSARYHQSRAAIAGKNVKIMNTYSVTEDNCLIDNEMYEVTLRKEDDNDHDDDRATEQN